MGVGSLLCAAVLTAGEESGLLWGLLLVLALAVVAGDVVINGYYARAFGVVRESSARRLGHRSARLASFLLAVGAALFDLTGGWPVLTSGLVFGLAIVAFWAGTGRRRAHWPVLALVPAAAAFAPLAGFVSGVGGISLVLVAVGIVQIAGGALDHRHLRVRISDQSWSPQRAAGAGRRRPMSGIRAIV